MLVEIMLEATVAPAVAALVDFGTYSQLSSTWRLTPFAPPGRGPQAATLDCAGIFEFALVVADFAAELVASGILEFALVVGTAAEFAAELVDSGILEFALVVGTAGDFVGVLVADGSLVFPPVFGVAVDFGTDGTTGGAFELVGVTGFVEVGFAGGLVGAAALGVLVVLGTVGVVTFAFVFPPAALPLPEPGLF